jgi:hypothetical protein
VALEMRREVIGEIPLRRKVERSGRSTLSLLCRPALSIPLPIPQPLASGILGFKKIDEKWFDFPHPNTLPFPNPDTTISGRIGQIAAVRGNRHPVHSLQGHLDTS